MPLLTRGSGVIQRNNPHREGFRLTGDVEGRRVLLLDDTFTTGATLQSAAYALTAGGATVIAGIVIARKINPKPDYPHSVNVWERQTSTPFNFNDDPFWL